MAIVSKRADELKPGDILVDAVVQSADAKGNDGIKISTAQSTFFTSHDAVFPVAMPEFTPAQQHADALLAFVEAAAASPARTALLDKIHPPAPPTEAEYLAAITAALEGKDLAEVKQRLAPLQLRASRVAALKGK